MINQNNLTVIVLTHNDEEHIVDCLELLKFADELIVVDDESTDRTVELARKFTNKVFIRPLNNNFSNQRNFALNNAHNQWILFVDSDEFVSDKLRGEILLKIKSKNATGYYLKRIDFMWGRKILHGEVGEIKLLRLARKDAGRWHGKVHEKWEVNGTVESLIHPLIHSPHQSVKEFIFDVDNYSTLRANELLESNTSVTAFSVIAYPVGKFLQNYFMRRGYKDGVAGFIYAMIMSFHSFLVRGKLYLGKSNS
jgi:glycosyltransferase involved in cell wall biosynthesis